MFAYNKLTAGMLISIVCGAVLSLLCCVIFCCFHQNNEHQKVVQPKAVCLANNTISIPLESPINEYEEDGDVEELYIQHPVTTANVSGDASTKENDQDEHNDMIHGQIMDTERGCCTAVSVEDQTTNYV